MGSPVTTASINTSASSQVIAVNRAEVPAS
jgi:hypothetical protein